MNSTFGITSKMEENPVKLCVRNTHSLRELAYLT